MPVELSWGGPSSPGAMVGREAAGDGRTPCAVHGVCSEDWGVWPVGTLALKSWSWHGASLVGLEPLSPL